MTKSENDAKKSRSKDGKSTDSDGTESESPKVSPTGDMLTAHLLGMLNGWSAYGYELAQRLEEAGLGSYNKGSIYRNLRQMEDSGLVSSSWDTSKDGPARRIYDLTDTGSMFLKNWMTMADMHRNFLKTMIEMNPLIPSMSSLSRSSRAGAKKKDDDESEKA
jgi:PadR family transcriptional regulator PadR